MPLSRRVALMLPLIAGAALGGVWWRRARREQSLELEARLAMPISAPVGPLSVFHLGHSLVNRDMPAMLAQLAGEGHRYESQLGWGTTLKSHWGDDAINGFDEENAHPRFRSAHEAISSGDYDAIILTEMVEIRAALRYADSPKYLQRWAAKAAAARPDVRIYLYETWHQLDDAEGWLNRLDADLSRYWLDDILKPALARLPPETLVRVIPAGQVLAAFVRVVDAAGGIGNVQSRSDLFQRNADGSQDQIHLNDLGNYLVALVHHAVLYHRNVKGLPRSLLRADGSAAVAPEQETATSMQETVMEVLRKTPLTGVSL